MLRVYAPNADIRARMEAKQAKAHAGDCGVDLFVAGMVRPDTPVVSQVTVHTGVHVAAFDESGRPTGCLLYPRSSISKTHLTLANSVGVIDAGYRGEVMAKMNVLQGTGRSVDWNDKNLRLVQIVLPSMRAPLVEFVDSLDALGVPPDSRGAGGFGSTSVSTQAVPVVVSEPAPVVEESVLESSPVAEESGAVSPDSAVPVPPESPVNTGTETADDTDE